MKVKLYLFCLLILAACKSNAKSNSTDTVNTLKVKTDTSFHKQAKHFTIAPYKLIDDYMVTDAGYVDATENEGTYAVIQKGGKLVDAIEKGFGIQKLGNDNFLYFTITDTSPIDKRMSSNVGYKNAISGSFGKYILMSGGKKQPLATLTSDFYDEFSSPRVIEGKIYFWQIKKQQSSDLNKISSAEYDPISHSTQSHYLFDDDMGTDDIGYFPDPYLKNDTIYFNSGNDRVIKFSKDFKSYN